MLIWPIFSAMSRLRRFFPALALTLAAACGDATPSPLAPKPTPVATATPAPSELAYAEPPDTPLPKFRTGTLAAVEHKDVILAIPRARYLDGEMETLALAIAMPADIEAYDESIFASAVMVEAPEGAPRPYAFLARPTEENTRGAGLLELWIRRPRTMANQPLQGHIHTPAQRDDRGSSGSPGHHLRFRAEEPSAPKSEAKTFAVFAEALAAHLTDWNQRPTAFHYFAADRLRSVFGNLGKGKTRPRAASARAGRSDLDRLMETTSGVASIQEALQEDRPLLLSASKEKATIAVSSLAAPKLAAHPWKEMIAALGAAVPQEPLADAAPADFYYLRAKSLVALLDLLDQAEAWITPLGRVLDRNAEDRDLQKRYEAELGLFRGPLTRALGSEVVRDLAVVGSDPYFKEGTDLTFVFRVTNKTLFEAALASALAEHQRAHGRLSTQKSTMAGVSVAIHRSADGVVRQHRASLGDLEIVSNSPAALTRVIETIQGKHKKLSDELDFRYMLARDAKVGADVLAFLGDRFVAEVIGPRQKILEARRQMALAELSTPGYAALLHGVLMGKSPASVEELFAQKLLAKSELRHASGAAITFEPGKAPRSIFGTAAAMTALIDLPELSRVTESEKSAYERFARSYENNWAGYIDPTAIRVAIDPEKAEMRVEMRVLPLIDGSDYRRVARDVGTARIKAASLARGARIVSGIGQDSEIRHELSGLSRGVPGFRDFKLDWLGDWAMIGLLDRNTVAAAARLETQRDLELPRSEDKSRRQREEEEIAAIAHLPLYAGIGVRSTAGVTLALTALHKLADDTAPGQIDWGPHATHRGVSIVRVRLKEGALLEGTGEINLFYALSGGAFLISLHEGALRAALDARADGKGPEALDRTKKDEPESAQFVVELGTEEGAGLFTALALLFEMEALEAGPRSRAAAEALLYGAPEKAADPAAQRALALAYTGAVPVTPDGGMYTLGPSGVSDPLRGSLSVPSFPKVPVEGSPVYKLLRAVSRARAELSFDDEGKGIKSQKPMQSLHARVVLGIKH